LASDDDESLRLWKAVSALEAHHCETKKCVIELKGDIKDLRESKADDKAVKESTRLAKEVMDARLAAMNEFRDSLNDQGATFITRPEYSVQHSNLEDHLKRVDDDIRTLRESRAELQGKASQSQVNVALLIGVIGIILSLVGLLLQRI